MKTIMLTVVLLNTFVIASEHITPSQFRVELIKRCEVLGLHEKPNRKSPITYSSGHTGSCVQNLGCMREITTEELNDVNETKRDYMAWKYPVWCKVVVGNKRGWVRKQFLADKPCKKIGESADKK